MLEHVVDQRQPQARPA